ncbi:MAG: type II secretion system protein N [Desulforhopalus sp.]
MATRITSIIPLLFVTLICVIAVEGGYQAFEYFILNPEPIADATQPQVETTGEEQNTTAQITKPDYRIILQRNLFGPPPGSDEKESATPSEYPDDLEATSLNIILMGTISGTEGTHRAIILDKNLNEQELYETGDAIQGALVKEIMRGKVILALNGKDEILDMSEAAKMRSQYAAKNAARAAQLRRSANRNNRAPVSVAPGQQINRTGRPAAVSPRGTPRRIINRPRVVRPSRSTNQ